MPRPGFPRTVLEFQRQFSTDDACLQYLADSRWPDGFICPRCAGRAASWISTRKVFECKQCRTQTSVTAGTVMHRSKMPLPVWFWGAYLVTTHTPGLSALQFARQLDLHYETAFQMLHKLRAAMVRQRRARLCGAVEVDETYIGGERSGKAGRGAYGKVLVAGAVEVVGTRAGRVRLKKIRSASERSTSSASSAAPSRKARPSARTAGTGTPAWRRPGIATTPKWKARPSARWRSCPTFTSSSRISRRGSSARTTAASRNSTCRRI